MMLYLLCKDTATAEVVAASPEASPAQAPAPAAPEPEQAEEEVTPEGYFVVTLI